MNLQMHNRNLQGTVPTSNSLASVQQMIRTCIQCGTCTGSCPNAFAMDVTPRHLWRMVLMGHEDAIFKSQIFALCSACYFCTLRCPRGLRLTEAMGRLKQIAAQNNRLPKTSSNAFYSSFLQNVRRYGRIREMGFMTRYFISLKNPLIPLKYAPLAMKLMAKKKLAGKRSGPRGQRKLDAIFRKIEELEARP